MSDKQLTIIESSPVAVEQADAKSHSPMNLLAMAIKAGVPLGELVAMQEKWEAKQAKKAYHEAMKAFQAECPILYKTKSCGIGPAKYSPFENIIEQTKELRSRHGFSHQIDTKKASQEGFLAVACVVTHEKGHSETSELEFPIGKETRSKAGDVVMDVTKAYASSLSFASRRVFQNAFGLVTAGEDMDLRLFGEKSRVQGPSKIATINDLLAELWGVLEPVRGAGTDWAASKQWLANTGIIKPDEILKKLSPDRLADIIDKAKTQLEKES